MGISVNIDAHKILAWLIDRWGRWSSILVVEIIVMLGLLVWLTKGAISSITRYQCGFIAISVILVWILWYFSVRVPKNKRGKIGIALAVYAENNEQQKLIEADFLQEFRSTLDRSESRKIFHIINIPLHHSRHIHSEEQADSYRRVARCHMIVYGRARERKECGKTVIKINLHCLITHREIQADVSKAFSRDITEVFPVRLNIDAENQCQELEITSKWLGLSARYIVGTAALLSADYDLAMSIFESMHDSLRKQKSKLPAIKKIKQRIPQRLTDIYVTQIRQLHNRWGKENNIAYLEQTKTPLDKLMKVDPGNYSARLSRSVIYFVLEHNPEAAMKEIIACRNVKDASWRYSYAFLLAYKGRLHDAKNAYARAFDRTCHDSVSLQCETFIEWVLKKEPAKTQLYYCLGLINWHGKGDLTQAVKDMKKFVKLVSDNDFPEMKQIALSNIQTIEGEIKNGVFYDEG